MKLVKSYNDVLAFSTLYFVSSGGGGRSSILRSRRRGVPKSITGGGSTHPPLRFVHRISVNLLLDLHPSIVHVHPPILHHLLVPFSFHWPRKGYGRCSSELDVAKTGLSESELSTLHLLSACVSSSSPYSSKRLARYCSKALVKYRYDGYLPTYPYLPSIQHCKCTLYSDRKTLQSMPSCFCLQNNKILSIGSPDKITSTSRIL